MGEYKMGLQSPNSFYEVDCFQKCDIFKYIKSMKILVIIEYSSRNNRGHSLFSIRPLPLKKYLVRSVTGMCFENAPRISLLF